ncbi:CarboxypepD-reg-like domain-containing protein [Zobellia roscoffensis]
MSVCKPYFGISCFLFILLNTHSCFSQVNTKLLKGKIQNFENEVRDVVVMNLNSKKTTITDSLGLFSIEVKLGDLLRVTAVQYLTKDINITDAILSLSLVTINLVENVINLKDVTVTPYNLTGRIDQDLDRLSLDPIVTSKTLGLPNANLNVLSHNKRQLLVADRGKYARLMTIKEMMKDDKILLGFFKIGAVVNTDKIFNRISGKTKLLETMVKGDVNTEMEKKILANFSKETMAESFNIPESNINGFLTYCMSQNDFTSLSETANTTEIWAYLEEGSVEFKASEMVKE